MTKRNPYTAIFILFLGLACVSALFVTSHAFVNAQITPKWFGVMLCVGLAGAISVFSGNGKITGNSVIWRFCFVAGMVALFRNWAIDGFSPQILPCVFCLLLLLLFVPLAETVSFKNIAGILVCFAVALSLHGMLQYAGAVASGNSNFPVTGSFDNPAGFASALVCVFPLCFLFFKNKTLYVRWGAVACAAIIAVAVALSGSRAGMTAGITVLLAYLGAGYIPLKRDIILKIALGVAMAVVLTAFYLHGKDSADGRLLIWRCTLDMAADSPVTGHGQGAFQAKYMLRQADYFDSHPHSKYASLADNVLHPFNEYLLVLAEHGIIGLGVVFFLGFMLVRACLRKRSGEKFIALLSLLALAVFSCFSYPFKYPFAWLAVFLNIAVISRREGEIPVREKFATARKTAAILLSVLLLVHTSVLLRAETVWHEIAQRALAGETETVLPQYRRLYPLLGKNGLFLYNHAAELHEAGKYEASIAVFGLCTRYFNDMDVQMLLADNYRKLHRYGEAERHLKTAAAMCPVRFLPLYELAKLYEADGRHEDACDIAKQIINKKIKIPSATVTAIQNEMRQLVEKEGKRDSSTQDGTSDEPNNHPTRQGETREVNPRGSALPP
ncbi:MAG: O-antigen ligase family protein [Bacteroidales bacterium]|jgi:O-antigen ligase|nr:O-antigen ligase family protein [Bacteroidales bacterium]